MMTNSKSEIIHSMIDTIIDELKRIKVETDNDDHDTHAQLTSLIQVLLILNNILNLDTKSMVELSLAVTSFGVKKIEEIKKTKKDM
jgi:hypothetical protein